MTKISVIEHLPIFGFQPQPDGAGLTVSWNRGKIELNAWDSLFTLEFYGTYRGGESFGEIEFKLPKTVDSVDQLRALLAYYVKHAFKEVPSEAPPWLAEGLAEHAILPWVKEAERNKPRAECRVDRDWIKLAVRKLAAVVPRLDVADLVAVSFDGEVLHFETKDGPVVVPASGEAWADTYWIGSLEFAEVPRRFMRENTWVTIRREPYMDLESRYLYPILDEALVDTAGHRNRCDCVHADAKVAIAVRDQYVDRQSLVSDSHFSVSVCRCSLCGQGFARVFCETIDWVDGNDPQDILRIPISQAERFRLIERGEEVYDSDLTGLTPERRYLIYGIHAQAKGMVAWRTGRVWVPMHD